MPTCARFAQIILGLAGLFVTVQGGRAQKSTSDSFDGLKRGINISHWFSAQDGTNLDSKDFANIKQAGFDHVRLTVDPAPLSLSPIGSDRLNRTAEDNLDKAIDEIVQPGLKVVLALYANNAYMCFLNHNFDSGSDACNTAVTSHFGYRDQECTSDALASTTEDAFAERKCEFVALWRALARHYSGVYKKEQIFFEILNEPRVRDSGLEEWRSLEVEVIHAINEVAPGYTIIATAGEYSGVEDLLKFAPAVVPGANVVYTFHFYWPTQFAQQGQAPFGGYAYPSPPRQVSPTSTELPLDTQFQVNKYSLELWDATRIESEISFVSKWAAKYKTPVWCGEFGVDKVGKEEQNGPEPTWDGMRAKWLHDVRTALEANHIGWAVWDYHTADYGIAINSNHDRQFDKAAIGALIP